MSQASLLTPSERQNLSCNRNFVLNQLKQPFPFVCIIKTLRKIPMSFHAFSAAQLKFSYWENLWLTEFFSVRFHFQDVWVCDYLLRLDQCPICLQQVFLLLFSCPPLNLSFHEQFYIDFFSDFSTFQAYTVTPRTVLLAYMIIEIYLFIYLLLLKVLLRLYFSRNIF